MKSFIFWLAGLIIGALFGYAIAVFFELNSILAISCGIIVGSTMAITINILRSKEDIPPVPEPDDN